MALQPKDFTEGELTADKLVAAVDPDYWEAHGFPHPLFDRLRKESPIVRVEHPDLPKFWMVSKNRDIREISTQPTVFGNAGVLNLNLADSSALVGVGFDIPSLLNMDPPDHQSHRVLVDHRFQMAEIMQHDDQFLAETARLLIDDFVRSGEGSGDFVAPAQELSISAIGRILGLPKEHWEEAFRFANAVAASTDPTYRLGETAAESVAAAAGGLMEIFGPLVDARKTDPKDDLVSVLARAQLDDGDLSFEQVVMHAVLILLGGVETTRNVMGVGLVELIRAPGLRRRLTENLDLLPLAVEEMIRWTSPLGHMCRNVRQNVRIGDVEFQEGDVLAVMWPSASRDEDLFDSPHEFRIDRQPNPHLAFGIGEHVCLGRQLARRQIRAMFQELLPRLKECELAGPLKRARFLINGYTHIPINFDIAPHKDH